MASREVDRVWAEIRKLDSDVKFSDKHGYQPSAKELLADRRAQLMQEYRNLRGR